MIMILLMMMVNLLSIYYVIALQNMVATLSQYHPIHTKAFIMNFFFKRIKLKLWFLFRSHKFT